MHLTDFGSTRGEALDDNIVSSILFNDLSIKLDGPIELTHFYTTSTRIYKIARSDVNQL